jgi:hypothetical protein
MIVRCLVLSLAFGFGLGVAVRVSAAPQTFNTALPVGAGEFVFREQLFYRKADNEAALSDRQLRVLGSISVLGFGLTGDFAGFAVLPYLDKRLRQTTVGGRDTLGPSGFADARLFGRYTVHKDNLPGRTFRVATFLGIELPTGDVNDRDGLGRLPAPLQLGSGSWDPFGGVVLTYQTLDYQLDGQISYKLNTEANNFRFGEAFRFDASLQYRVLPQVLDSTTSGFLYAVLESNLLHANKNETNGVEDSNSGGTSLYISPGIQYVTKRWIIEGIVQLPLFQNLHGSALEDEFIFRAGFRFNF